MSVPTPQERRESSLPAPAQKIGQTVGHVAKV
ncbi:MAG: hypothetical protein ACJAS7_001086, partial [Alpinimonas sp.]